MLLYDFRLVFFFNDTPTTEIYTLSLHDALPILAFSERDGARRSRTASTAAPKFSSSRASRSWKGRSEEHTSELQSRQYLVCRLLLEKKKKIGKDEHDKDQGYHNVARY